MFVTPLASAVRGGGMVRPKIGAGLEKFDIIIFIIRETVNAYLLFKNYEPFDILIHKFYFFINFSSIIYNL